MRKLSILKLSDGLNSEQIKGLPNPKFGSCEFYLTCGQNNSL